MVLWNASFLIPQAFKGGFFLIVDDSFLIIQSFEAVKAIPKGRTCDRFPKHHFSEGFLLTKQRSTSLPDVWESILLSPQENSPKIRFQLPPYSNTHPKFGQHFAPNNVCFRIFDPSYGSSPAECRRLPRNDWKLRRLFWLFKLPPVGHLNKNPWGSQARMLGEFGGPSRGLGRELMFFRVEFL